MHDLNDHTSARNHDPPPPLKVMEALKILKGGVAIGEACKYTYCLREPTRKGLFLQPTPLEKPAASCFVCNTNTVSGIGGMVVLGCGIVVLGCVACVGEKLHHAEFRFFLWSIA